MKLKEDPSRLDPQDEGLSYHDSSGLSIPNVDSNQDSLNPKPANPEP